MIVEILDTAIVHSVINKPLYDFGKTGMIDDETHRKFAIKEIHEEMEHSDESEIEALSKVEHFLQTAPVGQDLHDARTALRRNASRLRLRNIKIGLAVC